MITDAELLKEYNALKKRYEFVYKKNKELEQTEQKFKDAIRKEEGKWYRILEKRTTNPVIKSSNQNMIQTFVREILKSIGEK